MTAAQIEILIETGELLKVELGDYASLHYKLPENFYPNFRQCVSVNEDESYVYLVSNAVYEFFGKVFDYKLQLFIESEIAEYKIICKNYLELRTVSKIEEIECCKEWLKDTNKTLDALYPDHYKKVDLVKIQKGKWLASLSYQCLKNIEWTKFIYFKGKEINPKIELSEIDFKRAFTPLKEKEIFDVILCLYKVKHLKSLIADIEKPKLSTDKKHLLEHNAVRMLLLFKEKPINQLSIESIKTRHSLTNKTKDILNPKSPISEKSDILKDLDNGNIRLNRVNQLRSILPFLETEKQKMDVNSYIEDLNKKGKTQF